MGHLIFGSTTVINMRREGFPPCRPWTASCLIIVRLSDQNGMIHVPSRESENGGVIELQ